MLIPNDGRLVVRVPEAETVSPGGVHLVNEAKPEWWLAEVLAVPEAGDPPFKVGDQVVIPAEMWCGTTIELDGEKSTVVDIDDVLARYVPSS